MDGSYKLESFTDNIESEVNRLKYQVDLFYKREIELYKRIGLTDGMTIIECGAGPGFLINNIVSDMPHCKATALEVDPYFTELLRKISESNGKKLFEVKSASIYETELPDNSFDFAIARLVIEHLKEPERAVSEVKRILKPGGKIVLVSNDFAYNLLTYPPIPELDEMYRAYIKSRISEGGNPLIGRQLPVLLKNGGFESVNIEVICVHSELEGDKSFLKAENVNISKRLVSERFLEKETLDSLIKNWYKMLQHPDHAFFRQLFVISGTKGTGISDREVLKNKNVSGITTVQSLKPENLGQMIPSGQETVLIKYLMDRVKIMLEQPALDIDPDKKLYDIDIDSIAAAELSGLVKTEFNTTISISEILQKLTTRDLVKLIMTNINSEIKDTKIETAGKSERKWLEGEL